jgi:hypothetical protein
MSHNNQPLYEGSDIALVSLFISGESIQYAKYEGDTFQDIPKYNGEPDDIYRVSNKGYTFRVKPTTIITKAYMHYGGIEELVQEGNFEFRSIDNCLFERNCGMGEHLEFTFVNGKLTKVEMKESNC